MQKGKFVIPLTSTDQVLVLLLPTRVVYRLHLLYLILRRNTANEGNLPPLVKRMHWAKSKGLVA